MTKAIFPDDWVEGEFSFTEKMLERFLQEAFKDVRKRRREEAEAFCQQYIQQGWGHVHIGVDPAVKDDDFCDFWSFGWSGPVNAPPKPRKEEKVVSIRMPFGKHKGTPIVNLPTDYLDWLLDWMDSEESGWMSNSRTRLFDELDEEYQRRKTGQRPAKAMKSKFAVSAEAKAMLPEFIKSGYRAMALKIHPDKGGTAEQMVALKELKEALEKL